MDHVATLAYTGPDAESVPGLVDELIAHLRRPGKSALVVVEAAMAHLNLVSIHPFRDGNGRISRIVQSLVLAREGIVSPEVGSIEQALAGRTGRSEYARETDVSSATASGDLMRPLDAGLLERTGQGRSAAYRATEVLERTATNP